MNWDEVAQQVMPAVVKIETPSGHGTGFLCFFNEARTFCGIATAHHVVRHAEQWQEPIRMTHYPSATNQFLRETDRVIFAAADKDSAIILVPIGNPGQLQLPEEPIQLLPTTNRLPLGTEVGWLGYPGIASSTLCFFAGNVSAWEESRCAYLIDGVAINGVSGGPVFFNDDDGPLIVGAIAAYRANRATGEALPGLSLAQDVSHFQEILTTFRNFEEAQRNKQQIEQQQAADAATQTEPHNPPEPEPPPQV